MIFGIDLVEWQLNISKGAKLTEDILNAKPKGHSVEVRLYAEDCLDNFFPAPGKVDFFKPSYINNARWEVGLDTVDVVSPNFDPMIAQAVSYEDNRESAIDSLRDILEDSVIAGTKNNKEFLIEILKQSDFRERPQGTPWLASKLKALQESLTSKHTQLQTKYSELFKQMITVKAESTDFLSPLSTRTAAVFKSKAKKSNLLSQLEILDELSMTDKALDFKSCKNEQGEEFKFIQVNSDKKIDAYLQTTGILLHTEHKELSLNSFTKTTDSGSLLAPVPGKLIKVLIEDGQKVDKGQTIMILESMKMEFEVKSTKDGIIKKILVEEGTQVDADTLLASFED